MEEGVVPFRRKVLCIPSRNNSFHTPTRYAACLRSRERAAHKQGGKHSSGRGASHARWWLRAPSRLDRAARSGGVAREGPTASRASARGRAALCTGSARAAVPSASAREAQARGHATAVTGRR